MGKPGTLNAITDVDGIWVGHYSDPKAASGFTVVVCPEGATGGVDVRGSAPGTRETDLLEPHNLVETVNAVGLCGGSLYGLAAVDGVVGWLSEKKWGFPLDEGQVAPIVPAAALFDLGRGATYLPQVSGEWGRAACRDAGPDNDTQGTVGAGTGARSGSIKGGLGSASEVLDSGITVGAIVAVNSLGSVVDPATGRPWEIRLEMAAEFGQLGRRPVQLPDPAAGSAAANTTIGVVATDAVLTKAQAKKLAQMAQDGLARAIRPAHTMFDGDTIFCLGTGKQCLPDTPGFFAAPQAQAINEIGRAMADCLSRAIIRGILNADSLAAMTAYKDLPGRPVRG
jgi:L-aminopeptidase/D-esterase-like protein